MQGILFFGQSVEFAGRGIAGYRLRTAAERSGYNVMIVDYAAELDANQIFNIIGSNVTEDTKFVGFSASWIEPSNAHMFKWLTDDFFVELKRLFPNLLIITGGHDEWNRITMLKYSDYHFHGYSDNTFVEFLKMINKGEFNLEMTKKLIMKGNYIDSNATNPVINPDDIETVLQKTDGFESYQPIPIELSRGCIFRCAYCRHPFQGKKDYDSYQRSPESIAGELKRNYELFGTTRYTVMDDTFNDSKEKIDRLQRAIEISKIPNFEFVAYIRPELLVTQPETIKMLSDVGLRGAFVGIESFKDISRRAIGRGMAIERVLEACQQLSAYNGNRTLVHASLIVGLPHESPEEILNTQQFLIKNRDTLFRSWIWQRLGLRHDTTSQQDSMSTLDKNFEKFGYKIPVNSGKWENEYFTWKTAEALTVKLNKEGLPFQRYAGWRIAGCWHINMPDEQIQNGNDMSTDQLRYEIKKLSSARATSEMARITK